MRTILITFANLLNAPFENCFVSAELWDPFVTSRTKEMLNAVDRLIDAPFFRTPGSTFPARIRLPHDLVEDSDAYRLRIDMPGLSKEEVSVHRHKFVFTSFTF